MKLVTRAEWGARSPKRRTEKQLNSASTCHWNGPAIKVGGQLFWDHSKCAGLVRGIQNFHMDGNGWSDIAYNFLECPHGYTFEGRGLDVVNAANGTNSGNNSSHAVMCIGGTGNTFTDAEKVGFRQCIDYIAIKTNAPNHCVGHRDHKPTQCPGDERYSWVHQGMPLSPVTPPTPTPAPSPTPPVGPVVETERDRIKKLQSLIGAVADGIFGPKTDAAINRNLIGWNRNLAGNNNRPLVAFLQRQGNRKFRNNMAEDGIVGPVTNHLIVAQLGQRDGIAGPKAWRAAVK